MADPTPPTYEEVQAEMIRQMGGRPTPQPTSGDDQPRSRWTADGDDTLVLDAHSYDPLRFTYEHRSEIAPTEFKALVAIVRDHAAVTQELADLRADVVIRRGLHAGAVDAVHELQARLDARGADLGKFTQSAVTKTKELEAKLLAVTQERDALREMIAACEELVPELDSGSLAQASLGAIVGWPDAARAALGDTDG